MPAQPDNIKLAVNAVAKTKVREFLRVLVMAVLPIRLFLLFFYVVA
jgi:hypothetical protein